MPAIVHSNMILSGGSLPVYLHSMHLQMDVWKVIPLRFKIKTIVPTVDESMYTEL